MPPCGLEIRPIEELPGAPVALRVCSVPIAPAAEVFGVVGLGAVATRFFCGCVEEVDFCPLFVATGNGDGSLGSNVWLAPGANIACG